MNFPGSCRAADGVGPAIWRGWLLLAVYGAVGVVLALIGKPYYTRRMKRRARFPSRTRPASTGASVASLS